MSPKMGIGETNQIILLVRLDLHQWHCRYICGRTRFCHEFIFAFAFDATPNGLLDALYEPFQPSIPRVCLIGLLHRESQKTP